MAYNNAFPVNYQYYPQYAQMAMPQSQFQTQNASNLIWVQGEAGAKSYLVAPNTTVQLWDSERQTIYLKSADASGMPSIKVLDYTIRQEATSSPVQGLNTSAHVNIPREEIESLQSQIDALRKELEQIKMEGSANA